MSYLHNISMSVLRRKDFRSGTAVLTTSKLCICEISCESYRVYRLYMAKIWL